MAQNIDFNALFSQMGAAQPSLQQSLIGNQLGGFQNFGSQLQGAMGAFGNVAALNSANNQALNQANLGYATGYQAPVEIERMRQEGQNQRMSALSPLLSGLFGGGSGSGGGGLTGFNAVGADGKSYASASLGSGTGAGGGSSGGQIGQPQPGNASTAQPTDVNSYTKPGGQGFGQRLSPEDSAAAMARFRATGHYSPMPYANRTAAGY